MGGRGSYGNGGRNNAEQFSTLGSEQEDAVFFEDMLEPWKRNLVNREEVAINEYTMYNNKQINEYLREGKVSDFSEEELQRQIQSIESGLNKFELKENVVLYRAGNSNNIEKEFSSFVSASTSQKLAESYLSPTKGADTLYIIQTTKGTGKGAYVASISEEPEEREFLLNRGFKPKTQNTITRTINGQRIKIVTVRL